MNVRNLVKRSSGGLATVYACPYCKHVEIVRKGIPGVGRGYGLVAGSIAQSAVVNHIKSAHADRLKGDPK